MIPLNSSQTFGSSLKPKEVYYFTSTQINSSAPHYFICIKKDETEVLLFSCCTSQGQKREAYHNSKGYPLTTLVYIRPGQDGNKFTLDTWVDCNKIFPFTVQELDKLDHDGKIASKGQISDDYYIQILIGLQQSPEIDDEIKDSLPKESEV